MNTTPAATPIEAIRGVARPSPVLAETIVGAPLNLLTRVELGTAQVVLGYQLPSWSTFIPEHRGAAFALRWIEAEVYGCRDDSLRGLPFLPTIREIAADTIGTCETEETEAEAIASAAEALRLLDAQPRTGVEVWLQPDRWRSPGPHPATVRRVRLHALLAEIEANR